MKRPVVLGVVRILESHGATPLGTVAGLLDCSVGEIRTQIEAFNDVDAPGIRLDPMFVIEPADGWPADDSVPPQADTDVLRFASMMTGRDLGLQHADATTLGPLLAAADELRSMEPENLELAAAVDILRGSLITNVAGRAGFRARTAAALQRAADQRCRVQITYSGLWNPKVSTRVIEPFRVVSTARGYELDAGPLDDSGQPRTFLVARIRDFTVLDETFAPAADMARAVQENRSLTAVEGVARHGAMWAVRYWAERVDQERSDADDVIFTAWVLPPVADRVAVMCLAASISIGESAIDLDEAELRAAVRERARQLMAHHGL